jgi:hypothetical protein
MKGDFKVDDIEGFLRKKDLFQNYGDGFGNIANNPKTIMGYLFDCFL